MATTRKKSPGKTAAQIRSEQLNKAADDLIKMAEKGGVEQNYFFRTTFQRYKVQLETLDRLKEQIDSRPVLIEKEYVKDRANLVTNPAITEYNKTSTAANQTAQTLIKIITTFASDPVMSAREDDDDCDL